MVIDNNERIYVTKKLFAEELGVPPQTITNWQRRYWTRGEHYTVVGQTTLIHRERIYKWLNEHSRKESITVAAKSVSKLSTKEGATGRRSTSRQTVKTILTKP